MHDESVDLLNWMAEREVVIKKKVEHICRGMEKGDEFRMEHITYSG